MNSQRAGYESTPSQIPIVTGRGTNRQRKIIEAERQLERLAHLKIKPNSQADKLPPLTMKTMITPGARDAPRFLSDKPEELRRFVERMEDLWRTAEITDDDTRKESLGKYADQKSEEEWKALDTYERGYTWDEFKNELIANYPEAAEAERGTPARIRQLSRATKGIKLGDLATLYAFRRSFIAEAKKLARPPAAMSNRELVELFIESLSESMAAAVLQYLGNQAEQRSIVQRPTEFVAEGKRAETSTSSAATSRTVQRRPEDQYDLEEVCRAAIHVSQRSQGSFHLMHKPLPESTTERKIGRAHV